MKRVSLLLFLAALVLVPALVLTGCSKKKTTTTTGTTPQATQATGAQATQRPGTTATSSSGGGSNASSNEVAALFANFAKVKSFKATISVEAAGTKQDGTMEYVAPDRYHFTLAGLAEVISIGNDSYTKIGSTWTKMPGGGSGSLFSASDLNDSLKDLQASNVQKGATDTVNGKRCQIYAVTQASGTTEICIADGLPLRIQVKDPTSSFTILFTEFDKSIEIKAPI